MYVFSSYGSTDKLTIFMFLPFLSSPVWLAVQRSDKNMREKGHAPMLGGIHTARYNLSNILYLNDRVFVLGSFGFTLLSQKHHKPQVFQLSPCFSLNHNDQMYFVGISVTLEDKLDGYFRHLSYVVWLEFTFFVWPSDLTKGVNAPDCLL